MKKHLFFVGLMAILFFGACKNPNPPLTDAQKAVIEKQVLDQLEKMNLSVEKADADGYNAFLSSNNFLSMISQGTPFFTRDDYANAVKDWFSQRKSVELSQKTIKANVLTENLVLLDQSTIFQATFKDDRVFMIHHTVSFLFQKEETGWKIIHGHESWETM